MARHAFAAAAALAAALLTAPTAAADEGQLVQIAGGAVQCVISPDNVPRGGGPMVTCERADGKPWGWAPWAASKYNESLPVAVMRGSGEFHWTKGTIDAPAGQGMVLSPGQTYTISGWTIQPDSARTRFTYDASGHGLLVNAEQARSF